MKTTELTELLKTLPPKEAELKVLDIIRSNLGDSQALQKMGMTVNVRVYRLPVATGRTLLDALKTKSKSEVRASATDLAEPAYKLREQHIADAEMEAFDDANTTLPWLNKEINKETFKEVMRQNYVSPKGGYTLVEIVNPVNEKTYTGECHFGVDTIYVRKTANRRAFGKAFSKMLKDSSFGKLDGKKALKSL
jgi:uncharacterized protein (DUF2147 family)